jgi:hypothetical protein
MGSNNVARDGIVVLPPFVSDDIAEIDVVTLGCVVWWRRMFDRLGRTATCAEARSDVPIRRAPAPSDREIRASVLDTNARGRFALIAEYGAGIDGRAVLQRGTLHEVDDRVAVRVVGRWSFTTRRRVDAALVDATFGLLSLAAVRLGVRCPYRTWREAFGSPSVTPVENLLRGLGIVELARRGAPLRRWRAEALHRLIDALRIAPGMPDAIALLPTLFELAAEDPGIGDDDLALAWRRARAHVGSPMPPAWTAIPGLLRRRAPVRADVSPLD